MGGGGAHSCHRRNGGVLTPVSAALSAKRLGTIGVRAQPIGTHRAEVQNMMPSPSCLPVANIATLTAAKGRYKGVGCIIFCSSALHSGTIRPTVPPHLTQWNCPQPAQWNRPPPTPVPYTVEIPSVLHSGTVRPIPPSALHSGTAPRGRPGTYVARQRSCSSVGRRSPRRGHRGRGGAKWLQRSLARA